MKKENKDKQIKARITEREYKAITDYAEAHSMSISEIIRVGVMRLVSEKQPLNLKGESENE